MLITIFKGANDDAPEPFTLESFADLRRVLGDKHMVGMPEGKLSKTPLRTPAFSPCEWGDRLNKDGKLERKLPNAARVHFGAIDIDGIDQQRLMTMLQAFSGLESFCYSTFSHGIKPGCSVRYLFAITRPIEAQREFPRFITGMQVLTGNIIDAKTLDATRLFYCPICRVENQDKAFIAYQPGQPLNVDMVMELGDRELARGKHAAKHGLEPETQSEGYQLTKSDLLSVAATIKRKKSQKLKEIGTSIETLANGLAGYAPDGEKDNMLLKVTTQIAEFFPYADASSLAPLIVQSIGATNARNGNGNDADADAHAAVEKLIRAQDKKVQALDNEQADHEKVLKARITEAFKMRGQERDHPYTEDELLGLRAHLELPSDEALDSRWIIQYGTAFYVLTNDGYLPPIPKDAVITSIKRDLAPATTAGVALHTIADNGQPVLRKKDDIMDAYGTVARSCLIDLAAPKSFYEPDTQRIVEAPCPIRDIKGVFHPHIHEWLMLLGGTASMKLLQWVSYVTDLSSPCVMLYLDGSPGIGKTLLMRGLAMLWNDTGNFTELATAIDNFNDSILRCALVCADEKIPADKMEEGTKLLREFQQNRGRDINRKFLPRAPMVGCGRIMVAANNRHLLRTDELLTTDDVDAISERVLYIRGSNETVNLLKRHGDAYMKTWVTEGLIAQHAIYLREHRAELGIPEPDGRFMINNEGHTIAEALATGSGERSSVLHWLVGYLQRPNKYDALNLGYCMIRKEVGQDLGELYVNPQALIESWECYQTNTKPKQAFRLSQAIVGLSHPGRRVVRVNGKPVHFYSIKSDYLVGWAEDNGISNRDEIMSALSKPTSIQSKQAVSLVKDPAQAGPMFPRQGT